MKKKLIGRCLLGGPLGLALSTAITILISLAVNDGNYYPVVPEFALACGGELNAVVLQALCSLLYGAAWAGASLIWEAEWSLLRQTATHLAVCSLATFPAAYFMRWMAHSVAGVLTYFGIFFGIYLVIWISLYQTIKRRVRQINAGLRRNGEEE